MCLLKELYLPFASLWSFVAVKTAVEPSVGFEEALQQAIVADEQMAQEPFRLVFAAEIGIRELSRARNDHSRAL